MSEKPLLLPSAKMATLVRESEVRAWARMVLIAVGFAVIALGVFAALNKLSSYVSVDATQTAFAPLGTLTTKNINIAALPAYVSTTTPITPVRLKIPSIGVDAHVERVGKKADGSMATPTSFEDAGWYELGAHPGQAGNAVIAGHVNNALTKAGVFEHLNAVKVGDYVTVTDASGKTLVYVVSETHQYATNEAPTASIFAVTGPSQLVLITCDGAWDDASHSYDKRLVVFARLTSK